MAFPMTTRYTHSMPFGAEPRDDGTTRFRPWAPSQPEIRVVFNGQKDDAQPMTRQADGWFELVTDKAPAGTRYQYLLPDGLAVPDPASRFQPEDVNGPSLVVDPKSYEWRNTARRGRPWEETVLYELHVGCFTDEGTYTASAAAGPSGRSRRHGDRVPAAGRLRRTPGMGL